MLGLLDRSDNPDQGVIPLSAFEQVSMFNTVIPAHLEDPVTLSIVVGR